MTARGAVENVFRTISHPTRRALLDRLAHEGEQPVHRLGEPFDVSQPALSQHLRVLREAGLVEARREGRERVYRLTPGPLREVAAWLEPYARFWRDRLEALGDHLDQEADEEVRDG
jgi:DNA-binding transcriptional ArsR family regulator